MHLRSTERADDFLYARGSQGDKGEQPEMQMVKRVEIRRGERDQSRN